MQVELIHTLENQQDAFSISNFVHDPNLKKILTQLDSLKDPSVYFVMFLMFPIPSFVFFFF